MRKQRLSRMLDIMIAIALFQVIESLPIPYPRSFSGFWVQRRYFARPMASVLWLSALWLTSLNLWKHGKRLSRAALLCGSVLMLCVLATPYATTLVTESNRALLSQALYGGLMMLSAAVCAGLSYAFDRTNKRSPLSLFAAIAIMVAGLILCISGYRSAMWMAVAVAAVWLILFHLSIGFSQSNTDEA